MTRRAFPVDQQTYDDLLANFNNMRDPDNELYQKALFRLLKGH